MKGIGVVYGVARGRAMVDLRLQRGDMETGRAKLPGGGLVLHDSRRFRCGNVVDLEIVYFLQMQAGDKKVKLTRTQQRFIGAAMPHLGLVETVGQVRGMAACGCRRIHQGIEAYRRRWRNFQLPKADRILSFKPERQTKESLRVMARAITEQLGLPAARVRNVSKKSVSRQSTSTKE